MDIFTAYFTGAVGYSAILLFGSTGEILTEKAGHLNLGIPGIMCFGALGGCFGVSLIGNVPVVSMLMAILFAFLFAGALGLLYSLFTVSLRCNQNITGLIITTFGVGCTNFFINKISSVSFAKVAKQFTQLFPSYKDLGIFGELFLSYGFMVYFAIIIAVFVAVFMKRTRAGLQLRAVGENPATADAAGINVGLYKYLATFIGSGIAGLGGVYYVFTYLNGAWEYKIDALGWLSIALVIFSVWKPNLAILGSFMFGLLYNAKAYIPGISAPMKEAFGIAPYLVTIIVLIITSIAGSKNIQPPASLGLNYFREDR